MLVFFRPLHSSNVCFHVRPSDYSSCIAQYVSVASSLTMRYGSPSNLPFWLCLEYKDGFTWLPNPFVYIKLLFALSTQGTQVYLGCWIKDEWDFLGQNTQGVSYFITDRPSFLPKQNHVVSFLLTVSGAWPRRRGIPRGTTLQREWTLGGQG